MRRIRFRPSHTTVVAYIALFIALTGGTAVALSGSNTVFTDDIANDTQPAGGGNPAGGLQAADLRANSVGSSEVTNGSITSGDLASAALGARAYGRVDPSGTLSRSKNVASVTHPSAGVYCITLAGGIDPASAVLVVGPDVDGSDVNSLEADAPVILWRSGSSNCPAGTLQVITLLYNGDPTDNNNGSGNTAGDSAGLDDQSFAFVVP